MSTNNNTAENYYTILGVDKTANQATIRKAYLKLSLKYHPDKNPENPDLAKQEFVKIGQAYEILSDAELRAEYDRELRSGTRHSFFHATNNNNNDDNYSGSSSQQYDSYREAFDAAMAGMSEDELRDILGVAAIVGSLVGSIIGSRLGKNNAMLKGVGSLVGSMVGGQAATSLVQTAHSQSKDRVERVGRGESVPPVSAKQAWKDLMKSTTESVRDKAAAAFVEQLFNKKPGETTSTSKWK